MSIIKKKNDSKIYSNSVIEESIHNNTDRDNHIKDENIKKNKTSEINNQNILENNNFENHKNDKILDLPINISVELGTVKIKIKDILNFSKGDMLTLNNNKEDPLKIFANNKLIAFGEIVMLNNKYGIRITNVKTN